MKFSAAVITVSDKGARGERIDTSGPALRAMLESAGYDVVYNAIVPDERDEIARVLRSCADEKGINLVLTTGGTGFSPRDITPEATLDVVERRTPGIGEAMRAESLKITPKGCLSRSEAGIRGRTLIVNLPGSEKAAKENLSAVLGALDHGLEMLLGSGSADCAEGHHHRHHHQEKKTVPSMDEWLREAKAAPSAGDIGMYLTHNGTVRRSAKAKVRDCEGCREDVSAMDFSYDKELLEAILAETRRMPGIGYVRAWLNEGRLRVGDDIMYVLIGGDIRPNVVDALQYLVGRVKNECVNETEIY